MRSWVVAGAIGAVLGLAWLLPGGAIAAPPPPPPPDGVHLGAGSCAAQACHGGTKEGQNEHTIWIQKDEHSQAYLHLLGDLAKKIQRRLKSETPAHEDATCIACHGTPEKTPLGDRFDKRDGVSCELCHGGSSSWLGAHAAPGWKEKKASNKAALGMRGLSTPRERVQVCMGCHIGAPGMEVNHDLIAAGHPALVFDAAVFMEKMPPHWRDDSDQTPATWRIGKIFEYAAKADRLAGAAARSWPDYSFFDCGSCHHALGGNNPYAKRDPPARAGSLPYDWSGIHTLFATFPSGYDAYRLSDFLPAPCPPGGAPPDSAKLLRVAKSLREDQDGSRPSPEEALKELDVSLDKIGQGDARATRRLLQQYAFALRALSPNRDSDGFRKSYAALEEALAERVYDPQRCAKLARAALADGR